MQIRGLGDRLDMAEVAEVYLPLSRLLSLYAESDEAARRRHERASSREPDTTTPFVVGVAGSVAVGKSTIARLLRELMSRWPGTPRVELVTTDGFLYPNAELERRGLMDRKGFPESYDRRALVSFLTEVKSGAPEVRAPFYSHMRYDIVPDAHVTVRRPDVVIVEGLNVLQPPPTPNDVAVSELFDFSIYVDADSRAHHAVVRRPLPRAAPRRVQQPELVLQRLRAADRRRGRRARRSASGTTSTSRTSRRTCCRPSTGRPSCCRRPPTTPSSGCCCASCDPDPRRAVLYQGSSHNASAYH